MNIDRKRQALYALLAGASYIVGNADALRSLLPSQGRLATFFGGLVAVCGFVLKAFASDPQKR